jgi:spore coat polysaccharide biosynthesis protein SpsF
MKNIVIISARMGSSRFPGKVLQKLWNDKTVLEVLIDRLKLCERVHEIVVATTSEAKDLKIVKLCEKLNIDCCNEGDKDKALLSVLRTINYIRDKKSNSYEQINIIDITADCPFIDPFMIDNMLDMYSIEEYEYLSNCMVRSYPIGFDIQIYDSKLLQKIAEIIPEEHKVHSGWNCWAYSAYIQNMFGMYKYGNITAQIEYFKPDWRIVLDYEEDLILLKKIIKHFNKIDFTFDEIMSYLKKNPKLLEINKDCRQKIAGKEK